MQWLLNSYRYWLLWNGATLDTCLRFETLWLAVCNAITTSRSSQEKDLTSVMT